MKILLCIFALGLLVISQTSAQSPAGNSKSTVSIGEILQPTRQIGNLNYIVSLSEQDFKNQKYVFYTDSNATIAYLTIDGKKTRLTGGHNPENSMIYAGGGYVINLKTTLKASINSNNADDLSNSKVEGIMSLYTKMGKMIWSKKIAGVQLGEVKK